MPQILLIDKSGSIKSTTTKDCTLESLCKKAGFKSLKGFQEKTVWNIDKTTNITLYGKIEGRAGQENKYDLPIHTKWSIRHSSIVFVNFSSSS